MGEVIHDERFLHRWEMVLAEAEATREFATRKIGQFALQLSGQMELPLTYGYYKDPMTHTLYEVSANGELTDPRDIAHGDDW